MESGKIHVLFIVPRCHNGGPVNVLRGILRYCGEKDFVFSLITTLPEFPDDSVLPEFTDRMAHVFVPMSNIRGLLGFWGDVKKAVDRLDPDVIHTTCVIPDRIVSRFFPQKQLTILHSDFLEDYGYTYGFLPGSALTLLHLLAVRRAKIAVAVCESLAGIFRAKYHMDVPFVRNGAAFSATEALDKRALREKLGLPNGRTIFVYAATICRRKNQRFLIEAFEKGPADGPLLVLAGDGRDFQKLREKYKNAKNTRLVGFISDVRDYYAAADYYVSASLSEGMPMSVLEAMACGLPPLLSDIAPHKEIVSLTDGGGACFWADDAASFQDAMHRLLEMDYARSSEKCRETVRRYFSAQAMSEAYQAYYARIREEGVNRGGR